MSSLKRFFGGVSKGPKTEVATSGTSSMDGLGISQAAIAEYDRHVHARRPPLQAPKAMAVGTAEEEAELKKKEEEEAAATAGGSNFLNWANDTNEANADDD
jgi:hypothetical protein